MIFSFTVSAFSLTKDFDPAAADAAAELASSPNLWAFYFA
jgi:hypothetical protein